MRSVLNLLSAPLNLSNIVSEARSTRRCSVPSVSALGGSSGDSAAAEGAKAPCRLLKHEPTVQSGNAGGQGQERLGWGS
eukprot:6214796-Pleurochrysis_carterae.AAC.1